VTCGRLLAAVCLSVLLIADTVYCRIREKEIPYILSFSIFSAGENRKSWLHSSKRDLRQAGRVFEHQPPYADKEDFSPFHWLCNQH
jgi:hypothetical protein